MYRKARPGEVVPLTQETAAGTLVNTVIRAPEGDVVLTLLKPKDRHKPGYMAEYMRKRRAKK